MSFEMSYCQLRPLIESNGKRIYHTSDTRMIETEVLPADRLRGVDVLCVSASNRGRSRTAKKSMQLPWITFSGVKKQNLDEPKTHGD